jgi:DNA repair exonuclease SbcCD ATPase subunit/CheY-like chemotaxis protein
MDPKNAARDYLLAAEKYIKDSLFEEALVEVKKAQEIDPSNIYTFAFLERIEFFRQQKAKENDVTPYITPENGLSKEDTSIPDTDSELDGNTETETEQEDTTKDETEEFPPEPDTIPETEIDSTTHEDTFNDPEQTETGNFEEELLEQPDGDDIIIENEAHEKFQNTDNDQISESIDSNKPTETEQPEDTIDMKLVDKIVGLEGRLQELSDLIHNSESESGLAALTMKIELLESRIESLQQTESDTSETDRFREFEEQLREIRNSITEGATGTSIDSLNNNIRQIEQKLNDLSLSLQAGQATAKDYERIESILNNLQSKVESMVSSLITEDTLTEVKGEIHEKVSAIEQRLNAFEQSFRELQDSETRDTSELESAVNSLRKHMEDISQRLEALQETVRTSGEIDKTTDELRSQLFEFENKLEHLTGEIQKKSDPGSKPEQLRDDVHNLNEQLAVLRESISNFEGKFEELKTELDHKLKTTSSTDESSEQFDSVKNRFAQLETFSSRLDDFGETSRHLLSNYADLEQRFQEFIGATEAKFAPHDEVEGIKNILQDLRTHIDEISRSTIREQELHQTQAEILSLYTDLEHRFNELIKKQDEQREDLRRQMETRSDAVDEKLTALQNDSNDRREFVETRINEIYEQLSTFQRKFAQDRESRIDKGEIDSRFVQVNSRMNELTDRLQSVKDEAAKISHESQRMNKVEASVERLLKEFENEKGSRKKFVELTSAIDAIYLQIEEILETLHFEKELRTKQDELDRRISDITQKIDLLTNTPETERADRDRFDSMDRTLQELQRKFDTEQKTYRSKLEEISGLIKDLMNKSEAEEKEREKLEKRQVENSIKRFWAAVERSWENGAPSKEQMADLRSLAEHFSIPESVEKQIMQDVKLKMYSRAVKKAIAEKKTSKKEALSFDNLRKQYDVSLEEYMEYESKFLDDLVSSQFQGTILLVSGNETLRNEISERLKSVGFAVVNSQSPETAIAKLDVINPHLIICDTDFPGEKHDGLHLLKVVRGNVKYSFLPCIMIAGQEYFERVKSSLGKPNEQLILKPVDFFELQNIINDQLKKLRDHLSSQTL